MNEIASQKNFERWWKNHGIHRQGVPGPMLESYLAMAQSAWKASAGMIPKSHADERLERLEERAQHLRTVIFNARPQPMYRANAELSALEWAIDIVRQATERP